MKRGDAGARPAARTRKNLRPRSPCSTNQLTSASVIVPYPTQLPLWSPMHPQEQSAAQSDQI